MDDVLKIDGITQEHCEVLLAFLSELTEDADDSTDEGEGESDSAAVGGSSDSAEVSPPGE